MSRYIAAIDQGTSSSRTVLFDSKGRPVESRQREFEQIYPKPGWVEHDPESIWSSVREVTAGALAAAGLGATDVAGIGITNQRETTVVWNRDTGKPVYNAIVWQDRRTADVCRKLQKKGLEDAVSAKTGLRLDPYFSATKVAWILDHVDGARRDAEAGRLAFGTIDTFMLWRMTGGKSHVTDATNASRTLMFNIHENRWDPELLDIFGIPDALLPEVRDSAADFGTTDGDFPLPGVPVRGVAGDQQAALIGQSGFERGATKSTYGTGCFVITNTGTEPLASRNKLLTTIAYRLDGDVTYGLEGSIFVAGSAIQWLRDELRLIEHAADTESIAQATGRVETVHVVPAFTGLGAPYWDPDARGAILGLTRDSGRESIVTATLQAIAYQTCDLLQAMTDDGITPSVIRVDGGMVANDWFLQFLADMLQTPIDRPAYIESTVAGAAYLAALHAGLIGSLDDLADLWSLDSRFDPGLPVADRDRLYAAWQDAVSRVGGAR